jgi:sugar/nucleoside kinase (ribokinase family)
VFLSNLEEFWQNRHGLGRNRQNRKFFLPFWCKMVVMKGQTLVLGSTVVDVLLGIPRLPRRGEDVNISYSAYRLGGCAYNVYKTLLQFNSPALLCSPVGQGPHGRMVREKLLSEGITPFVDLEEENGCCYCLLQKNGERTFLSYHGAEYFFSRSWMENIDYSQVDSIFICGLEVEEPTGAEIVEFAREHPEPELYFAPGPRITRIAKKRMERLFARHPILHLSKTEACSYAGTFAGGKRQAKNTKAFPGIEEAAEILAARTGNAVVITLGSQGCYYRSGADNRHASKERGSDEPAYGYVAGFPAVVRNTVGAGDAHCGALIAALKQGKSLEEACSIANKTGAKVCEGRFSSGKTVKASQV